MQVIVLEPAGANGSDTSILSLDPLWNFGADTALWVGPNATTGGLARSLLAVNLAGIPGNATVVNATLSLMERQGTSGTVQVHRAFSVWTEGTGGHSWTVLPVIVRETAGVNRTLEPVEATVTFPPNSITDPVRDLRVYLGRAEVPSQVYGYGFSGGAINSAKVFFDATVGAYQTKTFDIVYSTNGTGVPAYRTATWSSAPLWTYGPTGGGASGATVADIDRDGRLEILFGGSDGYVYCLNDRGQLKWRTLVSPGQSIPFTPQVADVDHSGTLSVVVSTNAPSVVRLNSTGAIVWTYNSPSTLFTTPTLVDVNADGVMDALVGSNSKNIVAIDGRNGAVLRTYNVPVAGYTATIADIDRSGRPEILVDGDDKLVHAFALNGTQLWANAPAGVSFLEGSVGFGAVSGNGIPEIVTGDNGNNGIEFALYASNGTVAWTTTLPTYRQGGQTLVDLTGNGVLSTLVGVHAGSVYDLRGTDGSAVWTYTAGTVQAGTPVVANLDRSGSPEIVFVEGNAVDVLNVGGSLVHNWTVMPPNLNLRSSTQYPMTSPALADLTGNGTLDLLVPSANGMEAFGTGGLDHDWRTWGYATNHTQRSLDGTSGTGAPFLQVTTGSATVHPAAGASWDYRDGVSAWTNPGGDYGPAEANATAAVGRMAWNVTRMVQDWVSGRSPNDGLVLLEAREVTGAFHVFASADSSVLTDRPRFTIAFVLGSGSTVNPPHIVGQIPNFVRPENAPPFKVNLTAYAANNGTPPSQLRWNVTGFDPKILAITGLNTLGNAVLTVYPQPGGYGDEFVTYWLTDPQGRFARQSAWINITFVDQPPTFFPPLVFYVRYNLTYVFDFGPYISDPDTPRSRLTLRSNDTVHTAVAGFNVSFRYPFTSLNTWQFVTLTVGDGTLNVSRVVALDVTSDDPPVVKTPIPSQVLWEGHTKPNAFNLGNYFADPNNDALYFSYGYSHVAITIHTNRSVDITAPLGWWGQDLATFRATDPTGALAEDTVLITVLHLDLPPSIGPVPNLRVHYDSPYSFNLDPYLSDPDTPVGNLIVTTSDPAHVTASGALLTLYYPIAYNNTSVNLTIFVSDGTFTVNKTIIVTIGNDWPPYLRLKMPDVSFPEGSLLRGAYNLTRYFADPDNADLFWSSGNVDVLVTIHTNASVDLTSKSLWHGTERVTFRATDPLGALQEDSVWVTVTRVEHAPYFRSVPEQFVNVTTTYLSLTPYLGDPDNNVSQLFLSSANSTHATVIGQGLLLRYSANVTDVIRVVVSDGNLTNATTIVVVVSLRTPPVRIAEIVPPWILWIPVPVVAVSLAAFFVYRRRQLEWALLVTNDGLLVGSVSRETGSAIDTDLLTGMLTTIMDFAKRSFSEEGAERNLEGLELGEKRVAIVKGEVAYLAVVYRGRTPGGLLRIMRSLLDRLEADHRDAFGDIVDSSKLGDVPFLLKKLVTHGSLPFAFVHFERTRPEKA